MSSRYTWTILWRFASNLYHCARLMGNPVEAYGYLRAGRLPLVGCFGLGPFRFEGRKEDWLAIREVLVNDEYACVQRLFGADAAPRILDLGANIGCFAIRVFLHCPAAKVASIEAAPDTFQVLETNRKLNPSVSWQALNCGIWGNDGPLTLMRRGVSVGHRVVEGSDGDFVQGISPQSLLQQLGWDSVDLVKVDIEGGEEAVIPAATDILKKTRFLIVEIHSDRIDASPVIATLKSVYPNWWQLNHRTSSKPLYIMSSESPDLGPGIRKVEL